MADSIASDAIRLDPNGSRAAAALQMNGEDAETVAKARITALVADIAAERGAVTRNRVVGALSVVLNWAAGEGLIERVVTTGLKALPEESRDRVLVLEELRRVWDAGGEIGTAGAAVRLLALLGQRKSEVADLEWRAVLSGENRRTKTSSLLVGGA